MTDVYQLSRTTGTPTTMTSSTQIFGTCGRYSESSGLINIGFDFHFDGTRYTSFAVNPAGHMTLGQSTGTYYYSPRFPEYTTQMRYPMIAPAYFSYGGTGRSGKVHYKVTGTAPNRVLTVEWNDIRYYYYCNSSSTTYRDRFWGTFQARLYEGSNKIEFWYGNMFENTSSYYTAIGIAQNDSRYISAYGNDFPSEIYVNGSSPTYNYRQLSSEPISLNTLYTFNPCDRRLAVTGDENEGGTADMENGDDLLVGMETMRGSSQTFRPFTLTNPANGCDPISYTVQISGTAAADYTMSTGTIAVGESLRPEIGFTPLAIGTRNATVTIRTSNNQSLSYDLAAVGTPRIDWTGNVGEGGTADLADGDTLLAAIDVSRHSERVLQPMTLANINIDPTSGPAEIIYELDDPSDSYRLLVPDGSVSGTPTNENGQTYVAGGASTTPSIVFAPHAGGLAFGSGGQTATLRVIADGEVRTFTLNGFSVAPALAMTLDGEMLLAGDHLAFRNVVTCVGMEATTLRFTLQNINKTDVVVHGFDLYQADGTVRQGGPTNPLMIDEQGELVPSHDYVLSTAPGIAPADANEPVSFPFVIPSGETRTYYLTFVAQRPDKRYARAFLRTDAVNFRDRDIESFLPGASSSSEVFGLMTLDLLGRGIGSVLARDASGELSGLSLTFDPVKVGESGVTQAEIHNTGTCDLRIDSDDLRLITGDIADFELLEVFPGVAVNGGDYLIPAGGSGTISARFTPERSGSRRASILLRTNDSTLITDGVTERGTYYLDLYGVGRADLQGRPVTLDPAVIDGPGSAGILHLMNASTEVIEIGSVSLIGPNIDEIVPDPANPWPAFPLRINPGQWVDLSLAFTPVSGSEPGTRKVAARVGYNGTESITVDITGLAGTRQLVATPTELFGDVSVPVGSIARRMVVLSNTGTFPVQLTSLRIEGAGADSYIFEQPERMTINPGSFEFIQVGYAPTSAGASDATFVISSNAVNGDVAVVLKATATGIQGGEPANGNGTTGEEVEESKKGAEQHAGDAALHLGQARPNPAQERVVIPFTAPTGSSVRFTVYNAWGEQVGAMTPGTDAGSVALDVSGFAPGLYYYRLDVDGQTLTRTMTVVR